MKEYKVIIIGAGTSGLTARREVAKGTDDYLVIDDSPLGTTCARVGCMPSKVLIQAANDFYRKDKFPELGILGSENLKIDTKKVMSHVRSLRDRFVRGVRGGMESWEKTHLLRGRAKFIDKNTVEVDGEKYRAEKFVLAPGSRPMIPGPWHAFKSHLLTTDQVFELEDLPKSVAVIGLGVIGVEIGQALSRLGVEVTGFTRGKGIGGTTDPDIQNYIAKTIEKEIPTYYNGAELKRVLPNGKIEIEADGKLFEVDKVLASVGRRPNVDRLGLENTGVKLNDRGMPEFSVSTLKLTDAPHMTFPGDVNADRPILHEAADEGVIAGYNTMNEEQCFKRRTSIGVTFTDPNIAFVGKRFADLDEDYVAGEVTFEGQGRSIVKLKEVGLLHVYVSKNNHEILGAEFMAPDGEHLAHLLSWAISMKLTVFEALKMPFYHPVIEEGLRTALRDAASQLGDRKGELYRCGDTPIR
ncbi:MAG: dihydrolipoyl dehydrogenase [Bdellovibrionales bacterium]